MEKSLRLSINSLLVTQLRSIIEDRLQSLDRSEINSDVYDSPNWAHKQADTNGMKRAYRSVLDLISFEE